MLPAFLVLSVAQVALNLWSRSDLSAFLSRNASIRSSAAFEDYKQLVRRQMRGALVAIVLGIATIVLSIALTVSGGLPMLGVVLLVNVPMLLLGMSNKKLENRVRSLQCADPQLAREYERIGDTWMRKALPDF